MLRLPGSTYLYDHTCWCRIAHSQPRPYMLDPGTALCRCCGSTPVCLVSKDRAAAGRPKSLERLRTQCCAGCVPQVQPFGYMRDLLTGKKDEEVGEGAPAAAN